MDLSIAHAPSPENASMGSADGGSASSHPLTKTSSSPLHVQLSDLLREKIYSREWGSRKQIPSEHELMDMFDLSRGTVRRAIKSLVDEGLLVQMHGRGTFVAEPGISHPVGVRPLSFAESLHEQGKDFKTRVIYESVIQAPDDVAHELELEPGAPVLFLRRVRSVEGEPIMCQEGWSNLRECPGLDKVDYTQESAFDAVQRCSGRKIKYSRIRYTARVAGKEHGIYLACEETAPVLVLEQTIRLADEVPVEWSLTWLKSGQAVVGTAVQPD
ncbi:MAG: GntR family transcriptional regulator [Atopobiaceae bacterium]|jgi:DNA-binding GntR family transcriptional regulator|nr:GntR family transcriptional regulator [Atopobiaceae bacterium]MCI2173868.1 GntR family transcriptional regulator [Atopobiaceae bacterium]MCI2208042.1 GntR family transcriptional regulator [Atopobiaceae bacterium]